MGDRDAGASRGGKRSRDDVMEEDTLLCSQPQTNNNSPHSLMDSLVNPNFEELARQFPEFGRAYRNIKPQDASSHKPLAACITEEFSLALTKALLQIHWRISLTDLPLHHLCPPVPNRYFLIHWLQTHLLPCLTSSNHFTRPRAALRFTGLDIGTGATCIYPLLFVASARNAQNLGSKWQIWASDVDSEVIPLANANVLSNQLQTQIQPILVPTSTSQQQSEHDMAWSSPDSESKGPLRQSLEIIASSQSNSLPELDFCLTNPPFYDDKEQESTTKPREGDGRARTSMTLFEGTYPGGEVGFCTDIFMDQCLLYSRGKASLIPGWTVVMCGKKTSFVALQHMLAQVLGFGHVCHAEFGPGTLTRWFLAWSWQAPPCAQSPLAKTEQWEFTVAGGVSDQEIVQRLCQYAKDFSLQSKIVSPMNQGTMVQIWQDNDAYVLQRWTKEDEELPPSVQTLVQQFSPTQRRELLPAEGHFLLLATVQAAKAQMTAFVHTPHAKRFVAKTRQQMVGEVCRTNRKWRRLQKRQQQQSGS